MLGLTWQVVRPERPRIPLHPDNSDGGHAQSCECGIYGSGDSEQHPYRGIVLCQAGTWMDGL
jgi:hypothetical protein